MSENIFAFTESSSAGYKYYPAYISINREANGKVSITVRSPEEKSGACGVTARVELDFVEFEKLKRSL